MHGATAVRVRPAFPDLDEVRRVVHGADPYWPLQRYAASAKELAALGRGEAGFVPPWFRRDVALGAQALVDGADRLLHNERFAEAAVEVFGPGCGATHHRLRERHGPGSVRLRATHGRTGLSRHDPGGPSGLAAARDAPFGTLRPVADPDRDRSLVDLRRPGGDFHYWPDGVDAPDQVERAPFDNVAVVADNERTFHGVAPLGSGEIPLPTHLTLDSELVRVDDGWEVRTPGGDPSRTPTSRLG